MKHKIDMNSDGLLILTFSLILGKPCQKITEFDQSSDSSCTQPDGTLFFLIFTYL